MVIDGEVMARFKRQAVASLNIDTRFANIVEVATGNAVMMTAGDADPVVARIPDDATANRVVAAFFHYRHAAVRVFKDEALQPQVFRMVEMHRQIFHDGDDGGQKYSRPFLSCPTNRLPPENTGRQIPKPHKSICFLSLYTF
jgi:hypothetical protein